MTSRKPPVNEPLDADLRDALLDAVTPVAPPATLRAKVLARVRAQANTAPYVTVRAGVAGWRELAPGIEYKMLLWDESNRSKTFLLRAAAGARLPAHDHGGFEECLVLEGEFSLGDLRLRAGDFHGAAAGAPHGEARTEHGVTVYLRASIDDYPGIQP